MILRASPQAQSSWPGLSRPSTPRRLNDVSDIVSARGRACETMLSILAAGSNTGMAGTSPAMTAAEVTHHWVFHVKQADADEI